MDPEVLRPDRNRDGLVLVDGWALAVAVVSMLIAGVGVWVAVIANRYSSQAVARAERANTIAKEANKLAESSDARGRERHDVRWEVRWENDGTEWHLYNRGIDTAFEVVLVARVRSDDHEERIVERPTVERNESIVLTLPGEIEIRERLRAQMTEWEKRPPDGVLAFPTPYAKPRVRYRLYWRSALGSPQSFDSKGENPSTRSR